MLNFDADVRKVTARYQCEHRFKLPVSGMSSESVRANSLQVKDGRYWRIDTGTDRKVN